MENPAAKLPTEALLAQAEWAHSLARRLVGESEADEVVQETWLAAMRRPPTDDRPLRPWLGRVLGNVVRQRTRGRMRREHRERETARTEALPSAVDLTLRAESQRLLIDALLKLDESKREIVLLRYFEGAGSADIARRQGVPAGTVRWRLHEALAALRDELDEREGGDRGAWCTALAPLLMPQPGKLATGLSTTILGGLSMKLLITSSVVLATLVLSIVLVKRALNFGGEGPSRIAPQEIEFHAMEPTSPRSDSPAGATDRAGPQRSLVETEATPTSGEHATQTATLALRFVDEAGLPIQGVEVSIQPRREGENMRSDAGGRVEAQLEGSNGYAHRTLQFRHPRFANDARDLRLEPGQRVDLGMLTLRSGGAVNGWVVDPDGRPRGGLMVHASGAEERTATGGGYMVRETPLGRARVRADEEGRFRLEGLLAGNQKLRAHSDDELWSGKSARFEVRAGEEAQGVRIVVEELAPELRIEGVVLDPEGAPVPRATVLAESRSLLRSGQRSIMADKEGRFRVLLEWKGKWNLTAMDPEQRFAHTTLPKVRSGARDVELRFEPARTLQLDVRAADGTPIENWAAVVDEEQDRSVFRYEAPEAPRLPNGKFTLLVSAPGFDELSLGPLDPAGVATDGEPMRCELKPLPGVRGVVTQGGEPVEGAKVGLFEFPNGRMTCDGFPAWIMPRARDRALTDARGRFEITLRRSGRFLIRAQVKEGPCAELGPFDIEPAIGLSGLELELPAGGLIEGSVQLADGTPAVGVFVAASRGDGHARYAQVDAQGHYELDELTPGRWLVQRVPQEILGGQSTFNVDGTRATFEEVPWNCEVLAGRTTRHDLIEGTDSSRVHGRLSVEGADLTKWTVELMPIEVDGPGEIHHEQLDADGAFELDVAQEGKYFLTLEGPGGLRLLEELALDGSTVEWRAALTLGRVELRNLGPGGRMLALLWEGPGELFAFQIVQGDAEGRALLDPVPVGKLRVVELSDASHGEDPRGRPTRIELEVTAGETTRAELP